MPRVFKRKRVVTDPETGQRTEKSDKKYSIEYRDEHGRKRRKVIASDKSVAARKLADALREIEKKKAGETDPFEEHRKKPLDVHLEEYGLHQRSRGTSIEQVLLVRGRVLSILDGCGFMFPGDIKNDPVQHFLYDQRNDRLSAQTCNHYITAIRQFVTWMVDRGRLTTNPIADLKKFDVKTDRRHDRRPLSSDEFVRLIQAARSGESVENVPGPERAICYLVSASTGFRRKELASLRRGSLILSTGVSLVTLEAEFAKNGKKASIPIQDHVGREIERWLSSRGPLKTTSYVFSLRTAGGKLRKTSKMMKMDLESARSQWLNEATTDEERLERSESDYLKYVSDENLFADFHSNRHTFITNLAIADVHPKVAQELARHSTIDLTMNIYTHVANDRKRTAIDSVPSLIDHRDDSESDGDTEPSDQ